MKEFLFIHDIPKAELLVTNPDAHGQGYSQNVAMSWMRCFGWEAGQAECQQWHKVTPEECADFKYVMFWLLTEPSNGPKYQRMLDVMRRVHLARGSTRHPITIAYADGPVGWGYQHNSLPLEMKRTFLALCREADFLFCYGRADSMSYWRAVRGSDRVFELDRPHPFDVGMSAAIKPGQKYGKHADPAYLDIPWVVDEDKGRVLTNAPRGPFIALPKGINNICEERGIFQSLAVAKYAQDEYGFTTILHTATPIDDYRPFYREISGLDKVVEMRIKRWPGYLLDLSRCMVGIHLDVLETRGQFALDCISVGIPAICSGSVAGQNLFPMIFVDHCRDIDLAKGHLDRLLTDEAFYRRVVAYAANRMQDYSHATVRRRFEEIVNGPR